MMKGKIEQKISLAVILCLAITSYAVAAPGGSAGSHGGGPSFGGLSAPGNSAFGHAQAGNPQTGSINSQYGQSTALAARSGSDADSADRDRDGHKKKRKTKKSQKHETAPGNSAFGRNQGGHPQTGSINSRYGQTTAAKAKTSHAGKKSEDQASMSTSAKVRTTKGNNNASDTGEQHRATGNAAFGHEQGGNPQTGSINSQYGQDRAAEVRSENGSTNSQNGDKDKGKDDDNDNRNPSPTPTP